MNKIKNVLLIGLGAIGSIYAEKLASSSDVNLKILLDEKRLEKYSNSDLFINDKKLNLQYVLPQNDEFKADLIIISVKYPEFLNSIKLIRNFVGENTIIVSLLNGISTEKILAEIYGAKNIVYSYFIGHSSVRKLNRVYFDGVGKLVIGPYNNNSDVVEKLQQFFCENEIQSEISDDILFDLWKKFAINVGINQTSAICSANYGEIKKSKYIRNIVKNLISEVEMLAEKNEIKNPQKFTEATFSLIDDAPDENITSMLQDIEAKRETEVELFAGEVIKQAEKFKIHVPYNQMAYDLIKYKTFKKK